MASIQTLRERYVGDSIATASPVRLLTMLVDRLCLDLDLADSALASRDLATASQRLVHAQDIIMELRSSLDLEAWDGAPKLAEVYGYLYRRLVHANVAKDAGAVAECRRLIEPLRDAWHEAATRALVAPTMASTA